MGVEVPTRAPQSPGGGRGSFPLISSGNGALVLIKALGPGSLPRLLQCGVSEVRGWPGSDQTLSGTLEAPQATGLVPSPPQRDSAMSLSCLPPTEPGWGLPPGSREGGAHAEHGVSRSGKVVLPGSSTWRQSQAQASGQTPGLPAQLCQAR